MAPKGDIKKLKQLDNQLINKLECPGVYLLIGDPEHSHKKVTLYIGEATQLSQRLTEHAADAKKDYWSEFICFQSPMGGLDTAKIKYLERRLLELAYTNGAIDLKNGQRSKAILQEQAQIDSVESFLNNILFTLSMIGFGHLTESKSEVQTVVSDVVLFYAKLKKLDLTLKARDTSDKFILLKGSMLRKEPVDSITPSVLQEYNELSQDESMVKDRGAHYELLVDLPFSSPSRAYDVAFACSAGGPNSWKTAEGLTLKAYREQQSADDSPKQD